MQSFRMVSAIAVCVALAGGTAFAQSSAGYRGEAKLLNANAAPREETISGAAWRCDGDACVGTAARKGNVDGVVRECKKVVAVIGPVASYRSGARELDPGQIRACNKGAIQLQTARN